MCDRLCANCLSKKEFDSETEKLEFVKESKIELPKHLLKQLKCRARLEDPYTELGGE